MFNRFFFMLKTKMGLSNPPHELRGYNIVREIAEKVWLTGHK